ncbi:hypothetical protein ACF08B_41340 [Streptomyces sp. NPDC015139]|uniref:hypothetical protein n=1 Tax=Streptomyces sp. NPDC015139 TaxID=3364942 RepID=UPI0037007A94
MAGESVAAGVGAGITGRSRFRPVAAWAWMWRNFDAVLDGDPSPVGAADKGAAADRPLPLWPGAVPVTGAPAGDERLPLG